MQCPKCGYKLSNKNKFCTQCGNEITPQKGNNKKTEKKGLAILSMWCGIIGTAPALSILSIVAVISGHIALIKIKKYPQQHAGKKRALAGLILGYIGIIMIIVNIGMKNRLMNSINSIDSIDSIDYINKPIERDELVERVETDSEIQKIFKEKFIGDCMYGVGENANEEFCECSCQYIIDKLGYKKLMEKSDETREKMLDAMRDSYEECSYLMN